MYKKSSGTMNFRKPRNRSRKNSLNVVVNSEKWRQYGKSIYNREPIEETEDDEYQYHEIKDWVEEFFVRKSLRPGKSDQDVDVQLTRKQTLILSTLVPDEILLMNKFDTVNPSRFVGVLLMADVSGYTALSERYNNTGKSGTYRLTVTLNTYLGSLIELIYGHGGDILKFAGDAFLALWKTDKKTFLCHTIHTVIACALVIQQCYGSYETDVKVNLNVKLAISAGNLLFSPIGTGIDMNYVIFGLPVVEAKLAESLCASGEVKLTPTAWGHCYSRNYDYVLHEDGHVTIKTILYDPHEKDVTKPFSGFGVLRKIKRPFVAIETLPDFILDSSKTQTAANVQKRIEALSLRKTILLAEEKNIGYQIRKFMIRPVLTQIDAHQPLEYLTEMRQVSVLFITLKPRECPFLQLITIVNNSYRITCEIVYKSMGCVNKIILFDKDVMILVIFGLRGFKHESEAQAALKCGYSIKKSVSALDGVLEVSIGVTTGQVYCGVVGHPLRREFTVIGAVVNKAARLMCAFRNKITCDEATFVKSKMSANGFTLQCKIDLKGIMQPGKIYEYTEEIRVKELYDIPTIPPLLDRTDELKYFNQWITNPNLSFRDFDALLVVGESRLGKSRLLEWMARMAKNNGFKVCYMRLTSVHSATSYLALSQIITQMLGIKEPVHEFEKEKKIVELLKIYEEDLCHLNGIIKVRFAYHEGIYSQDETIRKEKAKEIFIKLLKAITEVQIIILDDLQNLDPSSWEFISLMLNITKIFLVFSITRGKFSSIHSWLYNVFINNNIRKIVLGPLSSTWIPSLACQILNVNAVPNDLCNALKIKCNGMPGLVESFIVHLFSSGALEIKKIQVDEIGNWKSEELHFPDPALLHPQAIEAKNQETLDHLIKKDATDEIFICIVTQKEELKTNINVQNIDALIMIQIDSLTPYQQLLLKISSVIGNVLSRDLLESIMYENNSITTAKAIKRLFVMKILTCANVPINKWNNSVTSTGSLHSNVCYFDPNLTCECSFDYDPNNEEKLPKYAFCKIMKFRNKNSRKTCYELLPMNQKKEFHCRIVNYLENNSQKCSACGGKVMIVKFPVHFQPDISHSIDSNVSNNESSHDKDDEKHEEVRRHNIESHSSNSSNSKNNIDRVKSDSSNNWNKFEVVRPKSDIKIESDSTFVQKKSQITPILKTEYDEDIMSNRRSTKRVTIPNFSFKKQSLTEIAENRIFYKLRAVTEAKDLYDWQTLGVTDSQDDINLYKKNNQSFCILIEKGVSQTDFNKCTCAELNITIYEQLIYHAQNADLKIKTIEFIIKFSYLNVLNNTTDVVLSKLHDAEKLCIDKELVHNSLLSKFDKRRFLGRIYSLKAAVYMLNGNMVSAKLELERASRIYSFNLDKVTEFLRFRKLISNIKWKRRQYRKHKTILKSDSVFCLNVATLLYSTLGDEKISRIAAFCALDIVKEIECNIIDICDTFSNGIHLELERNNPELTADIERMARQAIKRLSQPLRANELCAVGKLFMSTFRARLARGELTTGIRAGLRSIAISNFVQINNISIDIIPNLFYALLARCRIEEAVDVLQLARSMGQNQATLECETWYYALCMDLILDAGFQLETLHNISRFAKFALVMGRSAGASRRRLVVGLWTFWLRADFEGNAQPFEAEALSWSGLDDNDGTLSTLLSALRLVEGMLESLVRKMGDLKKLVDLVELRSIADRELCRLEKYARMERAVYPRWLLLKANSYSVSGRRPAANASFNLALDEAQRMNNRLEENLLRAATSTTTIWTQNARTGCFPEWQDSMEQARVSWHQLLYKMNTSTQ